MIAFFDVFWMNNHSGKGQNVNTKVFRPYFMFAYDFCIKFHIAYTCTMHNNTCNPSKCDIFKRKFSNYYVSNIYGHTSKILFPSQNTLHSSNQYDK